MTLNRGSDIRPKLIKAEFDMQHIESCFYRCHERTADGRVEASREHLRGVLNFPGIKLMKTLFTCYFQQIYI